MSSDAPGPSRSRRRYMPGSARSKTIELGTLSEIEEDMYQNRKDLVRPPPGAPGISQDDSCIGTVRRPTKGSVRSLARHLSERHKAERASHLSRQEAMERHTSEESADIPRRRNSVSAEETPDDAPVKTRQFAQEMRVQRSVSERRDMRDPLSKWSPSHSEEKWGMPPPPMQPMPAEYHMRPPSAMSRHGSAMGAALSRSSSMAGRMLMYDPRTMSLVDPRISHDPRIEQMSVCETMRLADYPVPMWFPPPQPVYIPMGNPMMPYPQKRHKKPPGPCREICCGGVAQLLWTIIVIVLGGVVATLVLALFYV